MGMRGFVLHKRAGGASTLTSRSAPPPLLTRVAGLGQVSLPIGPNLATLLLARSLHPVLFRRPLSALVPPTKTVWKSCEAVEMASPGPTAVVAAPLAHFEEDWQDFNEFQPSSSSEAPPPGELAEQVNSNAGEAASGLDARADPEHCFSGEFCGFESMEDLVQDFDAKLSVCFRNYNTASEHIAPIRPITEEHFLKDDE